MVDLSIAFCMFTRPGKCPSTLSYTQLKSKFILLQIAAVWDAVANGRHSRHHSDASLAALQIQPDKRELELHWMPRAKLHEKRLSSYESLEQK